jgi:signal peptidase
MSASGGALEALPPPAAAGRVPDAARQAFRRANRAARPALVAVAVLFWLWFMLPQALGGRAGWVLVDGKSMLPRYKTGDLVLVERQSHYRVGEVIAYRVPKGDPMAGSQVIHRIVGGDGTRGFVVKGDNRTAPDVWHPRDGDVVGAKLLRVPHAILLLQFLRSPLLLGLLASFVVFAMLLSGGEEAGRADEARSG